MSVHGALLGAALTGVGVLVAMLAWLFPDPIRRIRAFREAARQSSSAKTLKRIPEPTQPASNKRSSLKAWTRRSRNGLFAAATIALFATVAISASIARHSQQGSPVTTSASVQAGINPSTNTVKKLQLVENFTTQANEWPANKNKEGEVGYHEGKYRISMFETRYLWVKRAVWAGEFSKDVVRRGLMSLRIEVEIEGISRGHWTAGVFCRAKDDGYQLEITSNRTAAIYRVHRGWHGQFPHRNLGRQLFPAKWHRSISSKRNHIRADCLQKRKGAPVLLRLWVNGDLVAHATDSRSPLPPGHVGLYAETSLSPMTVDFDNFRASEL